MKERGKRIRMRYKITLNNKEETEIDTRKDNQSELSETQPSSSSDSEEDVRMMVRYSQEM